MLNGAVPGFAIAGGLPLAAIRGLFDASLFSVFGSLLFWAVCLQKAATRMAVSENAALDRRLLALVRAGLVAATLAGAGWLVVQSGLMSGASGIGRSLEAVPTVVGATLFGHLLIAQMAGIGVTALLLGRGIRARRLALACAAVMLLMQTGHGHALSMYGRPSLLLLSDAVHLLAGGAWLGGLLPLLLAVRTAPPRAAANAARSFSLLGKWCVGLMAATAAFQGWVLVGSIPALVGTAYGWTACLKLLLFGVLLGFAWVNRYQFAPALLGASPGRAGQRLVCSISVQTGFGLLVLLAAGVLSSLPPGMHEQAVWPFSQRPSLVTIDEDPDFRREVVLALLALGGAVVLATLGLWPGLWRQRGRLPLRLTMLAAALAIGVLAVPHLDLLFVEANPASFYHSPSDFAATSIEQGAALYPLRCAACHGTQGRGDGPLAAGLPVPPADLTAAHLWMHDDGEMFWWLTHGIEAPDGGLAMPGFASVLSPDQRWALIDFVRARNAGLARHATGAWPNQIRAPSVQADCAGGQPTTLSDLHGRVVRIVFGNAPVLPDPDLVTVVAGGGSEHPEARTCIADDQAVGLAYALISGLDPGHLAGVTFLVDANGWLRDVVEPASATLSQLEQRISRIRLAPLGDAPPVDHAHMAM